MKLYATIDFYDEMCYAVWTPEMLDKYFKTMKEKNISSYRLEKLGFSRATYYSIQQGNSISTNTVNQLCKLLKCEVSDIMEFVDEDEKKEQKTE